MKNKKFEKLFTEDFEKTYNVNYDKEEVLKHFVPKEKQRNPFKTKLILKYVAILLVGMFIGLGIGYPLNEALNHDNIITKEFEEFVSENGDKINKDNNKYKLVIKDRIEINIFSKENKNIINYYYIIKTDKKDDYAYLLLNNERIIITHNSFGILESKNANESQTLEFSIEIDGEIKEFILN